jgi:hypothetical protein
MGRSKRKETYIPKTFESERSFLTPKKDGSKATDVSANIYISMLQSMAWHKLTGKQKELYLYCKAQYYGEKKSKKEHLTEDENNCGENIDISKRFTMNKSKWCEIYGIYSSNGQRHFYADMKALIENGFIKVIQNGKSNRTKNIYEYSDKWRELGIYKPTKKE